MMMGETAWKPMTLDDIRSGSGDGIIREQSTRIAELEAEYDRLRVAFHDAIRRPLGVTPDSGAEFYDPRMADEAEARRPRGWSSVKPDDFTASF
jgi:hypothetical protein